ncbi:MAG: DegT/DnrJ/EryC1/StrS family aminotransferase, partial [Candidatus Bathyarchaeota archaeon]|nr:DegT/DnrJ/EryC1/StrS family aminotransferase [Candidatus Bathyarchaeota archaeon]
VGSVQLKKLDRSNEIRRKNASVLTRGIKKISGLTPPYMEDNVKHVFYQYVIRVEENYSMNRDKLAELLREKGVGVAVHYPTPVYEQPLYKKLGYGKAVCPTAEDASKRVLSLPVHPSVDEDDIAYMLNVLKDIS